MCYVVIMKEILKYLRQLNSFTQSQIAGKIGLSRQSYMKYENGSVVPSDNIVDRLAAVYGVAPEFLRANKIPDMGKLGSSTNEESLYKIHDTMNCEVHSSALADYDDYYIPDPPPVRTRTFEAYFDGNAVRIIGSDYTLHKGQHFKIIVEESEIEKEKKRKKAWETIKSMIKDLPPYDKSGDDDPFYKKALMEALDERYGM